MFAKLLSNKTTWLAGMLLALILTGCSSDNNPNVLSGTAATGAPIDGFVYVKDATGTEINVATGVDGSFALDAGGMTPPFMVRVVPNGGGPTLYSYASANGVIVNVTPLTNLAMFLASSSTDLDAIYNAWTGTGVSSTAVKNAQAVVNANLQTQLTAAGVDFTTYDFMSALFSADGTGIDGMMDGLNISASVGSGIAIMGSGGNIAFDKNIDTSSINLPGSGGVGGAGGAVINGTIGANETLATIPASIAGSYTLTYNENNAGSGIADGKVTIFVVGTDGTLTIDGSLVINTPVLRLGNAHEAIWKDTTNNLEYALSSLLTGFNEVNVSNEIPYTDPGFEFYGQYRL